MDEFAFIAELFAPLTAKAPGAFGLTDDAALLTPAAGEELVLTADAIVEGVHFRPEDPLELVARKALRTNLSDLAAKGAVPKAYLLTLSWPQARPLQEARAFANGLAHDQAAFDVVLLGGDTVGTPGPLTAAITAIGAVPAGGMVRRSTARSGDGLYVSGSIGDAAIGLRVLQGRFGSLSEEHQSVLATRYQLPQPRVGLATNVREHASAAIDVSDGLAADATHIARASGAALAIELERVPLSAAAKAWVSGQPDRLVALGDLVTGGDDYELLVSAPAGFEAKAPGFTRIGEVMAGEGVRFLGPDRSEVRLKKGGFTHF